MLICHDQHILYIVHPCAEIRPPCRLTSALLAGGWVVGQIPVFFPPIIVEAVVGGGGIVVTCPLHEDENFYIKRL